MNFERTNLKRAVKNIEIELSLIKAGKFLLWMNENYPKIIDKYNKEIIKE